MTPYGNVNFAQTGTQKVGDKDVPTFTQTTTLSPAQQAQLDSLNSLSGKVLSNVGGAINEPFSMDGLPAAPGVGDFGAERDAVTQALIARNAPQFERMDANTRNRLANQGISEGSEAYSAAMEDLGRQRSDFELAALSAGGAEQSRLYNMARDARATGIQERAYERSQPINEYATLAGLGGNMQVPQFSAPPGQIAPTDVLGPINLQYGNQMAGWQAKNQASQANSGAMAGLAGSAMTAAAMF